MTGVDTNILIQLAFEDHEAHAGTLELSQVEAVSGSRLAVPALVITEFLHVATDGKRFTSPMLMTEALEWTDEFLANPNVVQIATDTEAVRQALEWMRKYKLGRKRVIDTLLAAVFHSSGISRMMTSNPEDFAVFGVFEILTPIFSPPGSADP